jgi:hypothetical protein
MLFSQAQVWVVVVVLSGVAALAQEPNPAADVPGAQNGPPPIINAAQVPITVLEDTLIRVQTNEPINSKRAKHGTPVLFTLSEDVVVNDVLAIPRGAMLRGAVIESKKAGVLTGSPELALQLTSLVLCGRSYPLDTYQFKVKGTSKTKPTETKALRGAYVGAIVGALTGSVGGKGGVVDDGSGRVASMTAGAVVGAGVGTLASAATPGPGIWIPSEAQVDFYLAAPVTITPVSAKEAARLAQGLHRGGPTLYVRDTP